MQSGGIGMVNYNRCLTVHHAPEGIYVSVLLPFRLGHPPLLIPWSAIHHVTPRKFLWHESMSFEVGSPCIVKLRLARKVFEGI